VLDDLQDQSLRSIYGPQRLPGTRALLVLTAVAITTALFALYYLLGPGQKQIRMLIGRLKAQLPYRRLSRRLTVLEAEGATLDAREFYIRLVDAIQDYMTAILRVDCHAATTSELHQYLPTLATYSGAPVNQASPLRDVLRAADRAKFAHESIEPRTRELHVRTCGEVFQELETHRRRVRKRRKARGAYVGS
jgi:hypothetical protein